MSANVTVAAVEVIKSPIVAAAQRNHVLLVNVPSILAVLLLIPWTLHFPPTTVDLCVAATMTYATMGLGISVGFHRLLTHRAFKTFPLVRLTLAVLGSMAGQGPVTAWVSIHRRHHKYSDEAGDPHSPYVTGEIHTGGLPGFWHSHCGWYIKYDMPNPLYYCPDILRVKGLMFVSKFYLVWVSIGILVPGIVSLLVDASWMSFLTGVLWGGLLRLFVTTQLTWAVNSLGHTRGSRAYSTSDKSTNNALLGLLVFGEGWHNNHHRFPESAALGIRWFQVDFGYWFIACLRTVGLAWHVNVPRIKGSREGHD